MSENKKIDYTELFKILTEYNSKFNLTAIKTYEDFSVKHVKDSELGLPFVSGKVLDIGSGAGFPALVLKNEKPEIDITMSDSVGKKVNYLNFVIEKFGIEGARAVHTRIEDLEELENYDTVTARAVAGLNVLAEYALPFLKLGGSFVAYKAAKSDDEINEAKRAIKMLGGKIEKVVDIPLTEEISRRLVIIRKIGTTPKGYPRKGNKPRLSPL